MRLAGDDAELIRKRVQLIRLETSKENRIVSDYSQNSFGGKRQRHYNIIPTTKADLEQDVWLKISPLEPLSPGAYAIVFMPKDPILSVDAAYDFNTGPETSKP